MTAQSDHMTALMPSPAPLSMQVQDLRRSSDKRSGFALERPSYAWRAGVFIPALCATAALLFAIYSWLSNGGMTWLEYGVLFLIGTMFVWVSLSVSTVIVGLVGLVRSPKEAETSYQSNDPLKLALLVPIYNEVAGDVFGNAAAMLDDLAGRNARHSRDLFILSDTQDVMIAEQEEAAFAALRAQAPASFEVYYRRRAMNTDKKVGNLVDWITGWGAGYDAMLVLDADSLMSGQAIERLADELAADPAAGLIQSFPTLIGAETLFARIQQFSNIAYGWLLAEGLALWAQREGNYWGHNAIIRTRAFAASARLPYLRGLRGQKQLIMSHDFVEAGLMRRAGWGVRFLPRVTGSFEETPPTLIDYVLRDRRWCRGNLQHLRLLATRGFHPVSRFHLFHGAVSYLLSPAWFILLVVWALLGNGADSNVIVYFSETHPLFPDWPQISQTNAMVFLLIMYSMLLTPKITGALIIALSPKSKRVFGGARAFLTAFAFEVATSVAYAPILMVQQTLAVLRSAIGVSNGWVPQRRGVSRYSLRTLLAFHWFETLIGAVLTVGFLAGLISVWLAPIVICLLFAVPLSALSSLNLVRHARGGWRMDSPHTLREPRIVARARAHRARMHSILDIKSETPPIAAE
ncbi:MAG: glucans biosynthesis glucosyltransferase MdoH [Paracoccaceae bacterium]